MMDLLSQHMNKVLDGVEARQAAMKPSAVRVAQINPPIPVRSFDWMAWIDGQEESGPVGYGATKDKALLDLAEQGED